MITPEILRQAADILGVVSTGGTIVVVPGSMSVGTAENPAICLKKQLTVTWVKKQMESAETRKYVSCQRLWDELVEQVGINTIVVQENVFDGTLAYRSAVIWHEQGHVLFGAAESGEVYTYEVDALTRERAQLGADKVRTVLEQRLPAYRKAVDPGREALRVALAAWDITL